MMNDKSQLGNKQIELNTIFSVNDMPLLLNILAIRNKEHGRF